MDHYEMNLRKNDVSYNETDDTFNYYVNGGHWTVARGSDTVLAYDSNSRLVATYVTKHPVNDLNLFDAVVEAMMDARVTL